MRHGSVKATATASCHPARSLRQTVRGRMQRILTIEPRSLQYSLQPCSPWGQRPVLTLGRTSSLSVPSSHLASPPFNCETSHPTARERLKLGGRRLRPKRRTCQPLSHTDPSTPVTQKSRNYKPVLNDTRRSRTAQTSDGARHDTDVPLRSLRMPGDGGPRSPSCVTAGARPLVWHNPVRITLTGPPGAAVKVPPRGIGFLGPLNS